MKHETKEKRKVAIYARVSTLDKQDFERQINDLTHVITIQDKYDKDDIEVFSEKVSGYKKVEERPQLKLLEEKILNDPHCFDCIYVTEISRLGRDPIQIRALIEKFNEIRLPIYVHNITQKTLNSDGSRNFTMSIIIQVLLEFANNEATSIKFRSKSGLLQSAKNGNAGGGRLLPYGYTKDDKKLVIDEEEKKVVQDIFNWYLSGEGIKAISNKLNEKKIPTRSNKAFAGQIIKYRIEKSADVIEWSDKQIHDILRNTIYKGQRRYKGEILSAPSIISEELFEACKSLMESKTHRNYLTTYTYLLKDILVCGKCGRNYFAKYKPVERGDKVYICSSRLKKGGSCGNIGLNISLIESVLFDILVNTNAILKYINNDEKIKKSLEKEINRISEEIIIDENRLKKKDSELDNLIELRITNKIALDKYDKKYNDIESEISTIQNRIKTAKQTLYSKKNALESQNKPKATIEKIKKASQNREELQAIIRGVFKKMVFNVIDKNIGLVTVYITLNGVTLKNTLKLFLNLQGIKKRPKEYQYFTLDKMSNDPIFGKNVLLVDVDEIKEEFLFRLNNSEWVQVHTENVLEI